ncbi:MAG: FAD binding domain-containing protein, partial [Ardenticatenaceae bacterium]
MKPFRYIQARSLSEAQTLLKDGTSLARPIAGGTDLMGELKERVATPETLVSLLDVVELRGVSAEPEGLRIGAMTTLAELEAHREIRLYPAFAQAVSSVATPQIRNIGTLGGNLCQRPRCWYYRSPLFDCRKKGGGVCFAESGSNKFHAILGGNGCVIVHPSDTAVALISLDARATVAGVNGSRTMPVEDFFVSPDKNILAENVLQPGEILTEVFIPNTTTHHRSIYIKAKERQTFDFALASVAAALDVRDGSVHSARITLGGVAPVPYRAANSERALEG